MNEAPREKLKEILSRNGESLLEDPGRCEGLLRDHCGPHRREISALVNAMQERVPVELKGSWQTAMTPEAMRARLVQRLEDQRGLAPDVANWAVDAWSYALGVDLGRKSDPIGKNENEQLKGGMGVVESGGGNFNQRPSDRTSDNNSGQGSQQQNNHNTAVAGGNKKIGWIAAVIVLVAIAGYAWHKRQPAPLVAQQPCAANSTDPSCNQGPGGPAHADNGNGNGNEKGTGNGNVSPAQAAVDSIAKADVPVRVQLPQTLDSEHAAVGQEIQGTIASAVMVNGQEVIPAGSTAIVRVTHADNAGHFKGVPVLSVALVSVNINGARTPVHSSYFSARGKSRGKNTAVKTGVGAGVGALIGGIFGHGKGAAIGAGAGAGTALGYQGMTKADPAVIPAESMLSFRLRASSLHTGSTNNNPSTAKR